MIAASEPQEFVPFGRQQVEQHPGHFRTRHGKTPPRPPETGLAQQLSQVSINQSPQEEYWLREMDGGRLEEELYVKGATAVVSRGMVGKGPRLLHCCYSMESPIKQALWCNFLTSDKNNQSVQVPSLCLIDSTRIRVYTDDGEDYLSPLQFKVASVWKSSFGLLVERVSQCTPSTTTPELFIPTTIYSLLHPLDEISPVLAFRQGSSLSYMSDPCQKIVLTNEYPSICVLVDLRSGLHSLWKLRRATEKEVELMSCEANTTLNMSQTNGSFSMSSCGSLFSFRQSFSRTMYHPCLSMTNNLTPASGGSLNGTFSASPIFHSPILSRLSGVGTPRASRSLPCSPLSDSRLAASQYLSAVANPRPIVPQLCLDHIWTDLPTSRGSCEGVDPSTLGRVFLTTDLVGGQFLCFPVYSRTDTLACVRLTHTNTEQKDIIIGAATYIPARDAVPLSSVKMMVVLEPSHSIVLYSGSVVVGKLSLGGITAELASSSYLSAATTPALPSNKRLSMLSSTVIGEGIFFEERGGCVPPSPVLVSPDAEVQFRRGMPSSTPGRPPLSPPPPLAQDRVGALRDPTTASFTAEFENGTMFRFSLPEISSSPLVGECLRVLKVVLQRDDALHTLAKWYSVRNAPGTQDISPDMEWHLFITTILGLIGYEVENLYVMQQYSSSDCDTPAKNTKKRRASDLGSQEDWEYLVKSCTDGSVSRRLGLEPPYRPRLVSASPQQVFINPTAPLFHHIYNILFAFHLLYEEIKVKVLAKEGLPLLASLLYQLASDLSLPLYAHHYWADFPFTCPLDMPLSQVDGATVSQVNRPSHLPDAPPCLTSYLRALVSTGPTPAPFPWFAGLNTFTMQLIQIIGLYKGRDQTQLVVTIMSRAEPPMFPCVSEFTNTHAAVLYMNSIGWTKNTVEELSCGVQLVVSDLLQSVSDTPLPGWDPGVYTLIGRLDMVPSPLSHFPPPPPSTPILPPDMIQPPKPKHPVLKMRFNKDQRVEEAARLLESSEPVVVALTQRPEVTDHEFIEEQERYLYTMCNRTMALPVGRGMMELHTEEPVTSEPLSIPKICLSGRAPPRGTTVELSHIEVVPNMTLWPLFHNGVASGLRIAPNATINSTWISFNKPKNGNSESLPEHAGFLMALGLSGHLNMFNEYSMYEYLTKCHEMTSVGLLLGLAASKRGTMDVRATKLFSVHIESLLPPTSIELDVVQNIQVAALLGIGLIYQGTGHRHTAEVLLSEIGRPPGPEMENSTDRECYSLAAGLGLGLVVLGRGADPTGLQDLGIADTLHHYMVGGHKRPLTGSQKEKYKNPSYQIREEDRVNNNVTAPGAILALGLMYFNTGNLAVASWLDSPQSEYMLGFVCPDLLLLRMVARGLVMWDSVFPSEEWVEGHIPPSIKPYCLIKPRSDNDNIDYETMNQAYINLISGACFVLGLRFAGSANEEAYNTLIHYCKIFVSLSTKSVSELVGKSTVETCINVILLALAMVMSGTGEVEVVRLCRFLRSRVSNSVVTYGSHLATHMALGLLFLGGGAYTLSTSPEAIAALVCAFFPRFPTHSNDNRYHLQAVRHLYVLAAEPRLVLPRDIDTGELCYANLNVVFLDTPHYSNQSCTLFAPCLLPELHLLKEVRIEDNRYWPVIFHRDKNWDQFKELLRNVGCVGVKLRAGCLPYVDDPHGFRTLLAQSISTDDASAWIKNAESILAFTSDPVTVNLTKQFLKDVLVPASSPLTPPLTHLLAKLTYECVTRDKLPLLKIWIDVLHHMSRVCVTSDPWSVNQLRLVICHGLATSTPHLSRDITHCFNHALLSIALQWERELQDVLRSYMSVKPMALCSEAELSKLSSLLTLHSIPARTILCSTDIPPDSDAFLVHEVFKKRNCDIPMSTARLISQYHRTEQVEKSPVSIKTFENSNFLSDFLDPVLC